MKKYILVGVVLILAILLVRQCYNYKEKHRYDDVSLHKKLIKEVIIDLRDSACYREGGKYKRIYRRYNYRYTDSIKGYIRTDDLHGIDYATTPIGDTVFMEFTDYTNYPRRED